MTQEEFLKAAEKILGRSLTPSEKNISAKHFPNVNVAVSEIIINANKFSSKR